MKELTPRMMKTMRVVIDLLVKCDYNALERLTNGNRLDARVIAREINNYGMTLVHPPVNLMDFVRVSRMNTQEKCCAAVDCDLFTMEEGRSDLTLKMTLVERVDGSVTVEIDDIVVM